MSDYEDIKAILTEASIDFDDSESGVPRRHFIEVDSDGPSKIVFRFSPEGSLDELYTIILDEDAGEIR